MTTIVFRHIPSTAGLSFFAAISENLPRQSVYEETAEAPPFDSLADVSDIKLLRSHYTAHFEKRKADFKAITMLREPVSRFLSHYGYRKMCIEEGIDPQVPEMQSLESYISYCESNPAALADLSQLSWIHRFVHPESPLPTAETLFSHDGIDRCMFLLESHFALAGISNLFEESLFLFAASFPQFPPFGRWKRETLAKKHHDELDFKGSWRERLEDALWADIEFYEKAKKRLEAAFASTGPDPDYFRYKALSCVCDSKLMRHLLEGSSAYLPSDPDLRAKIRKSVAEYWNLESVVQVKDDIIARLNARIADFQSRETERLKKELGL